MVETCVSSCFLEDGKTFESKKSYKKVKKEVKSYKLKKLKVKKESKIKVKAFFKSTAVFGRF